ncbi:MAG: DUF4358 domain-containing protein [Oscillospiraceae bacterium]|nr:DUF4358 domain-containing protein [Oscillospiraceae bacterium]
MNKKILFLIICIALTLSITLVGCSSDNNSSSGSSSSSSSVSSNSNITKIDEALSKVKSVYPSDLFPTMEIDKEVLVNKYSIHKDDIKSYKAFGPMMSAHVDTFIAIESTDGKASEVESTLKKYKNEFEKDMHYPSNLDKVKASQVLKHGNDVYYIILGDMSTASDSDTEDQLIELAKSEVKKAVDAINSLYK